MCYGVYGWEPGREKHLLLPRGRKRLYGYLFTVLPNNPKKYILFVGRVAKEASRRSRQQGAEAPQLRQEQEPSKAILRAWEIPGAPAAAGASRAGLGWGRGGRRRPSWLRRQ